MEHSSKFRGTVKGMREDYDDKSKVSVEVELPAVKKKGSDKPPKTVEPSSYRPTRNVTVTPEMAATLSVGDPVECETTIRPFGRRSAGAGMQAAKAEEQTDTGTMRGAMRGKM